MGGKRIVKLYECINCFALRPCIGCDILNEESYATYKVNGGCPFYKEKHVARAEWVKYRRQAIETGVVDDKGLTAQGYRVSEPWWLFR